MSTSPSYSIIFGGLYALMWIVMAKDCEYFSCPTKCTQLKQFNQFNVCGGSDCTTNCRYCVPESDSCQCHDNGCSQCEEGYWKLNYDYPCLSGASTLPHCQHYTDFLGCQQCDNGYYLSPAYGCGSDSDQYTPSVPVYYCVADGKEPCDYGDGTPRDGIPAPTSSPTDCEDNIEVKINGFMNNADECSKQTKVSIDLLNGNYALISDTISVYLTDEFESYLTIDGDEIMIQVFKPNIETSTSRDVYTCDSSSIDNCKVWTLHTDDSSLQCNSQGSLELNECNNPQPPVPKVPAPTTSPVDIICEDYVSVNLYFNDQDTCDLLSILPMDVIMKINGEYYWDESSNTWNSDNNEHYDNFNSILSADDSTNIISLYVEYTNEIDEVSHIEFDYCGSFINWYTFDNCGGWDSATHANCLDGDCQCLPSGSLEFHSCDI